MPRARGIRGLRAQMKKKEEADKVGDALEEERIQNLSKQMHEFKGNLEKFAKQHKTEIKKNPPFRQYFHQMCIKIGVDPLASSKGFWAEVTHSELASLSSSQSGTSRNHQSCYWVSQNH